jgi:glycosyltransferase involved in cell wall biosynthesis
MNVYHCYSENLGDGMNPLLFNALTDGANPVSWTTGRRFPVNRPSNVIQFKDVVWDPSHVRPAETTPCVFGAGSILSVIRHDADHDVICGSGFISEDRVPQRPHAIISVRGALTRNKFLEAGIPCPERYGDLGLLCRYAIPAPAVEKKYKIGLIPHYVDKGLTIVKAAHQLPGWTVIDIEQAPRGTTTPEDFVQKINECEILLSSSLHGIIFGDSYGIPSHHVQLSDALVGGTFKFRDYYSSVGRTYSSVSIASLDTAAIVASCTPYTLQFDFDGYHDFIKKSLNALLVTPVLTMNTLTTIPTEIRPWPSATAIRLHMPAIPHTITHIDYSHCAFTGKVLRFAPMMRSRGFEVFHYGIEGSDPDATSNVQLMTRTEWAELRLASAKQVFPKKTEEELRAQLADPTAFVGDLANYDTVLYKEFNKRFRAALQTHYRSEKTDIVCLPLFPYEAVNGLPYVVVESGIGYPNSSLNYRIFESYAWMHAHTGKANGQNYWFVVPNYFDSMQWPLSLTPKVDTVGFLGRIYDGKGCGEIVEMARRMPSVRFVLCGQGDPSRYLVTPNLFYKPPIHGEERAEYLGSLVALVAPTMFVEPFCGVAVEAQLCGTPVITKDYGAQTETIEQFKTGLRCHTLADYCAGLSMALEGKFDRAYIRERAVRLYDMFNVAKQYEYTFKTLMDVHNGKNGWYSPDSHIEVLKD